jgi:hypothetical protein
MLNFQVPVPVQCPVAIPVEVPVAVPVDRPVPIPVPVQGFYLNHLYLSFIIFNFIEKFSNLFYFILSLIL